MTRLARQPQVVFFRTLHRASPGLSTTWWILLLAAGVLPAVFSVATGAVIDAIDAGTSLAGPLTAVGVLFVVLQVANPVQLVIGQGLGRSLPLQREGQSGAG